METSIVIHVSSKQQQKKHEYFTMTASFWGCLRHLGLSPLGISQQKTYGETLKNDAREFLCQMKAVRAVAFVWISCLCDSTLCWKRYTSTRLYYTLFQHSSWHNVASLDVAFFCTITITQLNLHISHCVCHGAYIIGNATFFAMLLFSTIVPHSTCATSVAAPSNAINATNPVLLSGTHICFWLFLTFVLLYLVYDMRGIAPLID